MKATTIVALEWKRTELAAVAATPRALLTGAAARLDARGRLGHGGDGRDAQHGAEGDADGVGTEGDALVVVRAVLVAEPGLARDGLQGAGGVQ
jgi:hypothetical protein